MDQLQTRLDALEQQLHTVTRRLRWGRGLACSLVGLGLVTWALPVVTAQHTEHEKTLEERAAALEKLLKHFSRKGNDVTIKGANLHIVNGMGSPGTVNGLGNLIVGYNELRPSPPDDSSEPQDERTGSHNVVGGAGHNFSRFGGLVVGYSNTISGDFAAVSGGQGNTASGEASVVSGGRNRTAEGEFDWVAGSLVEDE